MMRVKIPVYISNRILNKFHFQPRYRHGRFDVNKIWLNYNLLHDRVPKAFSLSSLFTFSRETPKTLRIISLHAHWVSKNTFI